MMIAWRNVNKALVLESYTKLVRGCYGLTKACVCRRVVFADGQIMRQGISHFATPLRADKNMSAVQVRKRSETA